MSLESELMKLDEKHLEERYELRKKHSAERQAIIKKIRADCPHLNKSHLIEPKSKNIIGQRCNNCNNYFLN